MQRINDDVCRVYAKMPQYRRRISETVENVSQMLGHVSAPYIAFSCGKDSSVMADLILQQDSTVPLRFLSSGETRILHNVDTVLNYFRDKYGAKIEEINIDRVFSDEWQSATFDEQRKAGRRDIQTLDNSEFDSVFMGLRIEESRGRAMWPDILRWLQNTHILGHPKWGTKIGIITECALWHDGKRRI